MAFLKRAKSITGKTYTKPSIKPQHTRKIIRRYHLLTMKRDAIYHKLSTLHRQQIDENNIGEYNNLPKEKDVPGETELLQINNMCVDELYKVLNKIEYEMHENGGLQKYQIASIHGQESKRGSDSSKWLFDTMPELKTTKPKTLEIGCLSTKNVISRYCDCIRIDLNSNEPGILKQDFMERLIPKKPEFGLVSCSLVLNFVPTPQKRGEMIQRFGKFLEPNGHLFIVLPLSCINNSRYCDKQLFTQIMESQGFSMEHYHETKKLVYMCFQLTRTATRDKFSKKKIHDGKTMNNFCIIL
jgi:25S rRNA (adenine2142-N1)-methyltransferase